MGLLRRAAGQPRAAGKPAAGQEPSVARRGLLGRTLGFRGAGGGPAGLVLPPAAPAAEADGTPTESPTIALVPPVREVRMAAQISEELKGGITALPDSVELPSRLFTLVAEKLAVGKGALLLYDALRLVYAPWASKGYDQTTLHRLRLPLGANESFNTLANGKPFLLTDPERLAPYQPFFSTREFSTLSRIFLAPFIAADRLVGVLLLSDLRPPLPAADDVLECLTVVAEAGSTRVDSAREKRIAAAGLAAVQAPASLEDQAARFLGARGEMQSPAVFLTLSVEEYARGILAGYQHLDPFRLYEDIRHFLAAFVADTGAALPVRPGIFIVGLRSLDPQDADLFTHQLTQYLDGLFGPGGATPPRVVKKRSWPAEGNDIRSLLDYLAS